MAKDSKGILYVMTSAVPGLIKIGKTASSNFEQRMYNLERNGYCNVAALKRVFAIEVDDYDEKEVMLQKIFEKSRLSNIELFALDVNLAIQLLSSFDGKVVYPKSESKEDVFTQASDSSDSKLIPNGIYTLSRRKAAENKTIVTAAAVNNGVWTLLKESTLATLEGKGMPDIAREKRKELSIDSYGKLLEDVILGECTPSFAGSLVMYQSVNGWTEWKDANGDPVDKYRRKPNAEGGENQESD